MLFLEIVGFAILIRCILSLFASEESRVLAFCYMLTEPFMAPVRNLLDRTALAEVLPIDLSYMATFLLISLCETILLFLS